MSWVLGLSILLSICVYIYMLFLGWLCRATCYFVSTFQCLVYHLLSKWKEALEFTYFRVIVEVLVLGLLVVVYEIPYSSCMWPGKMELVFRKGQWWSPFLHKKLKNVSCEYDRLNGWNSTLQAAWHIYSFIKSWKTSAVSTTVWMVETQLCKLRGPSDIYTNYRSRVFYVLSSWRI